MKISKFTTIVIVTYKGVVIKKTLKNLCKNFNIILVENSSNVKFKKKIEKQFRNIKVFLSGRNLGYAVGNNIGLKKVKTHYSLVLNPDVNITAEQVLKLEKIARKIKNFGILTCECNGLHETVNSNPDRYEKIKLNNVDLYKKKIISDYTEIPFVPGWCMFFKSKDLKNINYFDENFFLYFEDKDISKRIKKKNKKLLALNKIKISHIFAGNSRSPNQQVFNKSWHIRFWHLYWSSFYYYRKHYGLFSSIRVHLTKFFRFKYLQFYFKLTNNNNLSVLNKYKFDAILSQFKNKKALAIPKLN